MTTLREGANRVVQILRDAGFEAYFAGGCVRDTELGIEPKDYDIVSDARPEQVTALFKRTLQIGASFGVVKVLLDRRCEYEVATYREDGQYSDGRRPDAISYSSSKTEDVKRRDFTINGLLMDPVTDEVLDYVGGLDDLKAKRIRAVGDPHERFKEDRLRMLRAIRFAVRFGFTIEPETLDAIRDNAAHIGDVSAERIVNELFGIIRSPRPGAGVRLLADVGLMTQVLPFVTDVDAFAARMDRFVDVREKLSDAHIANVAWALALDAVSPADVENQLRALKLSKDAMRGAQGLLRDRDALRSESRRADLLRIAVAEDHLVFAAYLECLDDAACLATFAALRAEIEAAPFPERPLVTGRDLQALGMKPGRQFKEILETVDDLVLLRELSSKDEALDYVRDHFLK